MFIQQKMSKGYRFRSDALSSSFDQTNEKRWGGVGRGGVRCGFWKKWLGDTSNRKENDSAKGIFIWKIPSSVLIIKLLLPA